MILTSSAMRDGCCELEHSAIAVCSTSLFGFASFCKHIFCNKKYVDAIQKKKNTSSKLASYVKYMNPFLFTNNS